jgi:hypothetical protein
MNWIRENKFLAGFFGVVIAAAVAVGVLIFLAVGHYGEVDEAYTTQSVELQRLRGLTPFPDEANLKKFQGQGKVLGDAISGIETTLTAVQMPLEPTTPQEFQDKLRNSINSLTARATEYGVALPKDKAFALGFDRYQADLPNKDAAAPLARQLAAIELLINTLISAKVDSINAVDRAPLPEEKNEKPVKSLVIKHPFSVSFVAEQSRFRKLTNDIVTAKKQLYVIRAIRIKNQAEKAPSKTVAGAATDSVPAATDAKAKSLTYLFGAEKLAVDMNIDIVNFDNTQKK